MQAPAGEFLKDTQQALHCLRRGGLGVWGKAGDLCFNVCVFNYFKEKKEQERQKRKEAQQLVLKLGMSFFPVLEASKLLVDIPTPSY